MKKAKKTEAQESADRARGRIKTITNVMSKVNVRQDVADRIDRRRQHLAAAIKILEKEK